jgi:hypothetical protein
VSSKVKRLLQQPLASVKIGQITARWPAFSSLRCAIEQERRDATHPKRQRLIESDWEKRWRQEMATVKRREEPV